MSGASSIALSGLRNTARHLNIVAHNMANLQTPGFKAQQLRSSDVVAPQGHGAGVMSLAVTHSLASGPLVPKGEWSHLAINGSGFFAVQDPQGKIFYTRNGTFHLDDQGFLVNDQGYKVLNSKGNPMPTLDFSTYGSFSIDDHGRIWGLKPDGTIENLGDNYQVGIATFTSEGSLTSAGGTLYLPGPQSGSPNFGAPGSEGKGTIISGFTEGSNVSVEQEMIGMTMAKAVYTSNLKVISTENSMKKALLDIKT